MICLQVPLLAFLLCLPIVANAEVAVPSLTGHVMDQTASLTASQQAELEQVLSDFEAKKGSQIAVLLVPSTYPEAIEQYALRVAEQWKLGRKKVDDGAILLIAKYDRTLRIEVGYGLEGALNDATSKRIIAETITPYFKEGDFNGGIRAGVQQMIQVLEGEPLPAPDIKATGVRADVQRYFPLVFIVAFVVGGLLRALLGRVLGAIVVGGVFALLTWFFVGLISISFIAGMLALFFTLFSGSKASSMLMGGLGGGRGGFGGGGFGGGGFSGGGGGFGGGGASGKW